MKKIKSDINSSDIFERGVNKQTGDGEKNGKKKYYLQTRDMTYNSCVNERILFIVNKPAVLQFHRVL